MNINISYPEIQSLIKEHLEQEIIVKFVNEKTIYVGKTMKFLGIEKAVGMNVRVEAIEGNNLILAHDNAILVKSVMKFIEIGSPDLSNFLQMRPDNTVAVCLSQIPQLEEVLEHATLDRLGFTEGGVMAGVTLH